MKTTIKKEDGTNQEKSIQLMEQSEKLSLELINHFGEDLTMQFVIGKIIESHRKKAISQSIKKGLELKKLKAKTFITN